MLATVQMKEKVEGICDSSRVFALYSGFKGQVQAKCPISKEEMEKQLNDSLTFLKENPKFKSKGMVGLYINCKGEPLQWEIEVKTKSKELDAQILAIFKRYTQNWIPGSLNREHVDSSELFSYEIKQGKLYIN